MDDLLLCRSSSFHSAFQLLHYGHCPYFYVCANSLTILFLSGQVVKPNGIALLVPTTPGFRDAMKRQGIQYNMPLKMGPHSKDEVGGLDSMVTDKMYIFKVPIPVVKYFPFTLFSVHMQRQQRICLSHW